MNRSHDLASPIPFARVLYLVGFIVLARVVLGFFGLY